MSTKLKARQAALDIKALRLYRGWTQQQMADCLGCSLRAYQTWEQGVATPSIMAQTLIAKVLQHPLPLDWGNHV